MPKAILVPYVSGQNEPSKPFTNIVDLPDDESARHALMKELFFKHVFSVEDGERESYDITYHNDVSSYYSDCYVTYDGEVFLYATFIEEGV